MKFDFENFERDDLRAAYIGVNFEKFIQGLLVHFFIELPFRRISLAKLATS
jgi:hypothetical protein